ncbi:hypothetical protein [Phytohabitans rumicis]|uniref:Uncharacterized protein n=1 Tax=Phytohabitans rumicis TaxID=1076125 RepID=A0A6V8LCE9_9ACTN|nr:hypothetical protein [Phytohabitans rumicis]GFJ92668.1 hypothetical protein Prum_063100 [Phytohabitans rumicis]
MKGAIVGLDPFNPLASVIIFQYNPDTLSRTLNARTTSTPWQQSNPTQALRLAGPPTETIRMEIELDAADQLAEGDGIAEAVGVTPALAAIEMLLYPKTALIVANKVLAAAGVIEVIAPEAPMVLLVFGPTRVLPVRLTELSITEQLFGPSLNPIQAKVSLNVRVLNYDDLGLATVGGGLFLAYQISREVMATISSVGGVVDAVAGIGG